MAKKLGVNIDHVATIRQARRGAAPDPVTAAGIAELSGADGITVHLREDRRHIQDRDLEVLSRVVQTRINLEMAATEEMVGIALRLKPHSATIVPERREEITTEGGLDVLTRRESLHGTVSRLRQAGILVSLFIDPSLEQVRAARQTGADAVEIHTGTYCGAFRSGGYGREFEKIRAAAAHGRNVGLKVFAGHGLDLRNIVPILALAEIEEFNIGHSIIARAVFVGLGAAVREMADLIHGS
ncbi:MAG TPA: pyridoxine 5'-phosphate synthase [Candidatus Aquicultoraceae bacterium]|nr:pyridoxine 5'-phosphate synthase [Candidatus Aquicultoraceae bacterium]